MTVRFGAFAHAASARRLLAIVLGTTAFVAVALLVAPPVPAASYKRCGLTEREQQPPSGVPTYNLSLKRIGTTCATAKSVMKAFHACRATTSYRCTKTLRRNWRCTGVKNSSTELVFYATFTCKWGARRVKGNYQQNL